MNWPGTITKSTGDATEAADANTLNDQSEWLQEKGHEDHDLDTETGTGDHRYSVANPAHWIVDTGVVWSAGWWQAGDGSWWLLVRAADVSSFTRAQADFYIPTGNIADVPSS